MIPPRPSSLRRQPPHTAVAMLLLGALALSACATALPPPGQIVMRDASFPLYELRVASGLRVVVEEDRRSPVVAVVAVVGAGGVNDPDGQEGLAHVVEHMAFRARHAGSASVWTRLEQLGAGRFNAATGLDHTRYETLVPRESLPELLKLELQRLSAPLEGVTEQVFAVEREVVLHELRKQNETGFVGQIFHWVQENSFPAEHPYARPVIGSPESLSRLTLADAQRFAHEHYQPANMTLVITGDVELAAVKALLKQSLPEVWHGAPRPPEASSQQPQPAAEPPLTPRSERLVTHEAALPSPELYLTWVLPGGFDDASAVYNFLNASLSSGLFRAMLDDDDIAGLGTALVPGTRAALLLVRVALNTGAHPERSAERVLTQVSRLWGLEEESGDIKWRMALGAQSRDEVWQRRAFHQLRRSVVIGLALENEDLLTRTIRQAEQTHFSRQARAYGEAELALARFAGSKVTDFASQWLRRERARILLVRPGESRVPPLQSAQRLPPDEEGVTGPRGPLPAVLTGHSPVTSVHLGNGMEVLLVPRPGVPLVSVGVALRGGEVSDKPGVAELAAFASYPKSDLQGQPGDYGLRSSSMLYRDHLRYTLAGASGNVGNMLAILGERMDSMDSAAMLLGIFEKNVLPRRKAVESSPEEQAKRALQRALYGEHPYGHVATAEELATVKQSEVDGWISRVYRPANAVVVIAGEFDPQQLMPLVHEYLGGWKPQGASVEAPPSPALPRPSKRPEVLLTPSPKAAQGHVQIACRLAETTPEAEARYALMASMLGARMWNQLRAQMGATYGFQTHVSMARGGAAHLLLQGVVDTSQLRAAMTAVRTALTAYAQEGVPATEVESARSRLLAEHSVSLSTSRDWVDALLQARVLGWDAEAVTRRPALLQTVTPADLQKEFAACTERLVVGIIGDKGEARAAVQATFP